jgi:serine protease Do
VKRDAGVPLKANVVASDPTNDLAVLQPEEGNSTKPLNFRAGQAPKAGEEIVVFGYPKIDMLSQSGNLVTGNITALAGVGDDSSKYQISAPIQHGNSGGPVSDRNGHVVGIVVARLEAAGDQNLNFAIKSSIAENFLSSHGIAFEDSSDQKNMSTPDIGDVLRESSFLILCSE